MKPKDQQLASEIKKLHYELSFEHDLNRRLAEQLKQFQQQTRRHRPEEVSLLNLNGYMQQLFYIEPLLLAYDDKIFKLQQLLADLQEDARNFEVRTSQLTSQNNFLRTELESKCKFLLQKQGSGMNARYLKLENDNLREKDELIRQENEQFKRQLLAAHDQLQKVVREANRNNKSEQLLRKLNENQENCRQLEISLKETRRELQLTKQKLKNELTMHQDNQNRLNSLEAQRIKLSNQNKLLTQQLQNLRYMHETSSDQSQQQIQTLQSQLKTTQRREAELFQKNMTLESDLQSKNTQNHHIQIQLATLTTNNQNMLQMLQSYESRVANQTKKAKQAQQKLKLHEEKLKEEMKAKDLYEWKLQQKQQTLERRDLEHRSERQRLSKLYQERIEAVTSTHNLEREKLQEELSTVKATLSGLESRVQRLQKDNRELRQQYGVLTS